MTNPADQTVREIIETTLRKHGIAHEDLDVRNIAARAFARLDLSRGMNAFIDVIADEISQWREAR